MLGVFLFDLNRLEDAASELRQAIALDAAYANALSNLTEICSAGFHSMNTVAQLMQSKLNDTFMKCMILVSPISVSAR